MTVELQVADTVSPGKNGHASTSNGADRRADGRFGPGNRAARKHGLRATSATELQKRDRRARGYASRLKTAFAEVGRPLGPLSLPMADKWARLQVLVVDRYHALLGDPGNGRLFDEVLAAMRLQVLVEKELGMTPGTKGVLGLAPPDDELARIAAERRARLVPPVGARGEA